MDAAGLDRLHRDRPVRLQHRSGALWIVNTAGARALGLAGAEHPGIERDSRSRPTGRLWRADGWLRTRLPRSRPPGLRAVGAQLARLGITHVTDATPDLDAVAIDAIRAAMASGAIPQHVRLLGVPLGWAPAAGPPRPTAGPRPLSAWPRPSTAGPFKIILADSMLPDIDTLTERIRTAHGDGRAVAVHCVTREALVLLLAALDEAGTRPGDRIEHAALVPCRAHPPAAQPGADGRHAARLPHPARGRLRARRARRTTRRPLPRAVAARRRRRLRAIQRRPVRARDPWTVITAAVHRCSPSGHVIGPAERLTPAQALAGYLSPPDAPGAAPRRVAAGFPADLVLLRVPLARALEAPSADLVAATMIDGCIVPAAPE